MQPRIVDLFCGCGGFSLGAHNAGLAPTVSFDIDPILTSSISRNFPGTKLALADLGKIDGSDIEAAAGGQIDGLFGGPPCQGFSAMGHRREDDPRRDLLGHFFRLVSELKPAFFVMENVQGLGYKDTLPVLNKALCILDGRYELLGPFVLDAADFGAATRRPRLFVIGTDKRRCDSLSLDDIRAVTKAPATVRDAIQDLSSSRFVADIEGFDTWEMDFDFESSGYARSLASPDRRFTGHRRTEHTPQVVVRFEAVKPGTVDKIGRHPRLAWDGQCPTLRAGTGSDRGSYQAVRPLHPEEPRVITVREAARLQGFPDSFKFHPTTWHSFRMIGNSVSPIMAKALLEKVYERLDIDGKRQIAAE
ncbi:DNA cytosine methyltransferase [Rhizobium leguminosarum]|uniref:DNA cytosine methyltransferase n=1 Tax=Rhizobium leguminosarum TaxID=384 RepID=UPI00046CA381|nr:DNA cytosine methyltransferase [Rhizobium leguminosarum]